VAEELDGQIFLDPNDIPESDIFTETRTFDEAYLDESLFRGFGQRELEEAAASTILWERKLATWKDITTPPKSKIRCVKMCPLPFGGKTCCGWKTCLKWMYRSATLTVTTNTPVNIKDAVEDCIKQAAVAAAIAALPTGGSGAAAIAQKVFYSCLIRKFGEKLINVEVRFRSVWGAWTC
jgi:hypothetical protein